MKHSKRLTVEMKKMLSNNGYDYKRYLYIKNTATEIVFVSKDGDEEITINKITDAVTIKVKCPDNPRCMECKHRVKKPHGYECAHPRLNEAVLKYEERTGKKITKHPPFIGIKIPKTTMRYCPYKELKQK